MTFTVKYRLPGQWFWRTIKGVVGDYSYYVKFHTGELVTHPVRVFDTDKKERIEIPMTAEIRFDRERFYFNKKNTEADAGQPIATK